MRNRHLQNVIVQQKKYNESLMQREYICEIFLISYKDLIYIYYICRKLATTSSGSQWFAWPHRGSDSNACRTDTASSECRYTCKRLICGEFSFNSHSAATWTTKGTRQSNPSTAAAAWPIRNALSLTTYQSTTQRSQISTNILGIIAGIAYCSEYYTKSIYYIFCTVY